MDRKYEVWAPRAHSVDVEIGGEVVALHRKDGWWTCDRAMVAGEKYGFLIDGDGPFPDPRTRRQPEGIHGLSQVYTDDFEWTDQDWRGRELASMVIYELHVGVFSPTHDFQGVINRLDYLSELGITAIELMPVQPFGGDRGWGYDGVDWFAVHESYGGPDGLKALVDAAHRQGIAIILDVVYNHFGPDGNYTNLFGPYTSGGSTGWGEVVNISGSGSDEVRRYIVDAVDQWLGEFHVDGLRLDAVHAYDDRGAYSIMEDIQEVADRLSATTGVPRSIIAESDLNDPRLIAERSAGGYGLTGQWVDDIHHGLHTLVSGEDHAYYADFGSLEVFADTLRHGWRFNHDYSAFRGRHHGRPLDLEHTPAWRLITYTTTHDQTGNRAAGDRPSMTLTDTQLVLKAAVIFCSPFTPMLFMGEEFAAQTPFPFFCSHTNDELLEATREGRKREFARAGWNEKDIPDPGAQSTFDSAVLDWNLSTTGHHVLTAYTTLLRLRRELRLNNPDLRQLKVDTGEGWLAMGSGDYLLVANLSPAETCAPYGGQLVYSYSEPSISNAATVLGPWEFALIRR